MKKPLPLILLTALTALTLSSCTGGSDLPSRTADSAQSEAAEPSESDGQTERNQQPDSDGQAETNQQSDSDEQTETNEQPDSDEQTVITVTDDLGRQVTVAPPQRTAAMIGSFADIWCLAGGKDTLIAAANDTWTNFDLDLSEDVINLGSVKTPSLETLLTARPDLILASCNTSSNIQLMDTFEDAGIPVLYFDVETFDDYLRMLDICTQLTGCPENLELYGSSVKEQADAAIARQTGDAPTVLYIRASGSGCTVKGSTGNVLGEMLTDLGCINIADSDQSLLENLSLEAILAADPDYIFAVLQGSDKDQAQSVLEQTLLSNPAWQTLHAVVSGNFYTLDHTLYNLKPNARWGEAYEKLADILYPEQTE